MFGDTVAFIACIVLLIYSILNIFRQMFAENSPDMNNSIKILLSVIFVIVGVGEF